MDFIEELRWRGLIQDIVPGTEEKLRTPPITGYVGFDPTAQSLHIGNLVAIMLLVFFQRCGHKPIALVGGATGMIGDPSGKSAERNLLSADEIRFNQECIHKQLAKFLDFDTGKNNAVIVNNYDWFKEFGFLDFLRDVGKHLTVSYMMAKDSVQKRLESGLSFTEFSYQLLQGYDFLYLYQNKGCTFQMGGSDQWGNITAGTELIRRKTGADAYAMTTPLLIRSDGIKFGKSEGGQNIWLDASMTSPYKFYQFWLNCTDDDAPRLVRTFSLGPKEEVEALVATNKTDPHLRTLQKSLAQELTTRVHSKQACDKAVETSEILFGKGTTETLKKLSEQELLEAMEGVPVSSIARSELQAGVPLLDLLTEKSGIFPSKGEAKRMVQSGGININKIKIDAIDGTVTTDNLFNNKYILMQKGKKNYYLIKAE